MVCVPHVLINAASFLSSDNVLIYIPTKKHENNCFPIFLTTLRIVGLLYHFVNLLKCIYFFGCGSSLRLGDFVLACGNLFLLCVGFSLAVVCGFSCLAACGFPHRTESLPPQWEADS